MQEHLKRKTVDGSTVRRPGYTEDLKPDFLSTKVFTTNGLLQPLK